mmetsp:Transcript_19656/g.41435  ORF Transcript_19656/g.41435 Transcript_19656/m.41435 type:complete len:359 (+) Transcript_19656:42-1118(+)
MSDFSWEQKWVAIAPKPFAILSIIGSILIIKSIYTKRRNLEVFHRILLGLSTWDIMMSCAVFMGTWPIPKGSPGIFMASGTDATCSAQGFFIQMSVGTALYNAMLSVYYVLVINLGWKEYQVKRVEPILHLVPAGFSFASAVAVAAMDQYANSILWCFITPANNSLRMGVFYGPIWAALATATISMVAICGSHILQERKTRKYMASSRVSRQESMVSQPESSGSAQRRRSSTTQSSSQKVVSQAVFYVLSFYLTWIFPSWTRVSQMVHGSTPFFSIALFTIFCPCQGLFNCMVYFRPRVIKYRERHPEVNILQAIHRSVICNAQRTDNASSRISNVKRNSNGSTVQRGGSTITNESAV